jgi:deoxyribose-phosphate aldolase
MVLDLTYLAEKPSEAQEQAIQDAVKQACIDSLVKFLTEVADTMETNNIEALNVPTLRAMIEEVKAKPPEEAQ